MIARFKTINQIDRLYIIESIGIEEVSVIESKTRSDTLSDTISK